MNTTSPTTDPAADYRETLRALQAALEAEENVCNLEAEIEEVAREFDRISEAYETRLDDLHEQKAQIIKNAEELRQAEKQLRYLLPLAEADQQRVNELRQEIQDIKAKLHPAHEDRQRKRFALEQLEKELSRSNRRRLPEDQQTLADAQLALRYSHEEYERLTGRLKSNEWQVEQIFFDNTKRF